MTITTVAANTAVRISVEAINVDVDLVMNSILIDSRVEVIISYKHFHLDGPDTDIL